MAIPILPTQTGYFRGDRRATIQIEAFLDIQCPFSAKAWPSLLDLTSHYGDKIGLSVNMMVLSNHRQSWDITLLLYGIAGGDHDKFYGFTTFLYENQSRYLNGAFADQSHNDLVALALQLANEFDGSTADHTSEMMNDSAVYASAKAPIRLAANTGVWSTPNFFINKGKADMLDSGSNLQDWQVVLDPFLAN